jgi:hypothetical protein
MSKTRIVTVLAIAAAVATAAPAGAHSKVVRCDQHHPRECSKLRHHAARLERAVAWQKHARKVEVQRVLDATRGAQPFAYAAKLAQAACLTFSYDQKACRPPEEMLAVGRCESGLQNHDPNPVSTADGWMQFLDSTWANTVPARLGFSLYDPVAMAVAAEGMARKGWSAWAASGSCHGLA